MSVPRKAQAVRFDCSWLEVRLGSLTAGADSPPGICVAWSGGADSTALLAALVELRARAARQGRAFPALRAIHVDHHLQAAARDFRRHCRRLARQLRVPLRVLDAQIPRGTGLSLEEAARTARYELLARNLRPGEILLTGQHAEDQLETVLLQLLRGGGVAGIAGMPERAALGAGLLLRPVLAVPGAALRAYLLERGVAWIEDPSNADTRFDRNYLRREILPRLLARWPSAARTVARSARHAADADLLARREARRDAAAAADGHDLDLTVLRRLAPARQRAALRSWILSRGHALPDERQLMQALGLIDLRSDAQPLVRWAGTVLRRHAGRLHVQSVAEQGEPVPANVALPWRWQQQPRLALPDGRGYVELRRDPWGDVDCTRLPAMLELRFRAGGERVPTVMGRRDVKSLLREAGVPAWERARMPFVHAVDAKVPAGRLLAVGDLWVADELRPHAPGVECGRFVWQQQ